VLVVDVNVQDNVRMAARNVPGVEVVRADDLNAYQVVRFRTLMITKAGMEQIEKRLAGKMEEAAA
jgi:large subunit ribosomal protein L4